MAIELTNKLKLIVYVPVAVVALIASVIISALCGESVFYVFCFALFGSALATVIARIVLHILADDYSAEMWQVSIYLLVACFGWLGCIFASTWSGVSLCAAIVVAGVMMAVGNRFIKENPQLFSKETGTAEALPSDEADDVAEEVVVEPVLEDPQLANLKATAKYKFVEDNAANAYDETRPLCEVNGVACTVDEAYSRGWGAVAANGIEYLKDAIAASKASTEEAQEE